jgi:hypothetical protein
MFDMDEYEKNFEALMKRWIENPPPLQGISFFERDEDTEDKINKLYIEHRERALAKSEELNLKIMKALSFEQGACRGE